MESVVEIKKEVMQRALEHVLNEAKVPQAQLLAALQRHKKEIDAHAKTLQKGEEAYRNFKTLSAQMKQLIDSHKQQMAEWDEKVADFIARDWTGPKGETGEVDVPAIAREAARLIPRPQNGKDAVVDEDAIVGRIVARLSSEQDEIPNRIVERVITKLQREKRLDVTHIKNFQSFVYGGKKYKISELMHGGGSSSTNSGAPIYTETPSGAIDGVNTVYTTAHATTSIFGIWYNGQFIDPSQYTVNASGFTMTTALPVISGAALTILYQSGVSTTTSTTVVSVIGEVVGGSGVNFTLAHGPITGTVALYRGGARQSVAAGDYTISGTAITLTSALATGETLTADYEYQTS